MINDESLAAVAGANINSHFMRPLYDTYSFAQLPQSVRCLLTGETRKGVPFGPRDDLYTDYDTVILFFVDAFGWHFFEQVAERYPFLRRIVEEGLVCKLTSQFPSTTAAHVTTIHTGQPVGQSGIYEWYYYEPLLDALIAPLLFSYAGDAERNTLAASGVPAAALYPTHTFYHDLNTHGVQSFVFQDHHYARSPYTETVTSGATIVPYRTLTEGIVNLLAHAAQQTSRAYYVLYVDSIDAICHLYGPDSPQVAAEIQTFLTIMEVLFHATLSKTQRRTLFLMTADHGQTAIDPATTVYLNQSVPEIGRLLKTNRRGQPLVPAGSARDLFLHIEDEHLAEAQATLQEHLHGIAEVHRVDALIDAGFFGSAPPSATFRSRVGNLVILPYEHASVWWYEQGRFAQHFYGSHGGLTRAEMETLLLAQAYG